MTELSREDLLKVVHVVIEHFREEVDPDIFASKIAILTAVGLHPGLQQNDIPLVVKGLPLSSTSRYVTDYTHTDKNRKPGMDFIEQRQDPDYRRRNVLYLTSKGAQFLDKLTKTVNRALAPPKRGSTH